MPNSTTTPTTITQPLDWADDLSCENSTSTSHRRLSCWWGRSGHQIFLDSAGFSKFTLFFVFSHSHGHQHTAESIQWRSRKAQRQTWHSNGDGESGKRGGKSGKPHSIHLPIDNNRVGHSLQGWAVQLTIYASFPLSLAPSSIFDPLESSSPLLPIRLVTHLSPRVALRPEILALILFNCVSDRLTMINRRLINLFRLVGRRRPQSWGGRENGNSDFCGWEILQQIKNTKQPSRRRQLGSHCFQYNRSSPLKRRKKTVFLYFLRILRIKIGYILLTTHQCHSAIR